MALPGNGCPELRLQQSRPVIPLCTAAAPDPRLQGGAISIGNFDGVHRGHARLLERLCELAAELGGPAVAVTFDPPPAALLRPGAQPPSLTTLERREELLRGCGVDGVVVIETTRQLLGQAPEAFFQSVVVDALGARGIVEGPNFFFGRDRAGNPHLLERLCDESGLICRIVRPTTIQGLMISSTRVREAIASGDVAAAAGMLTRPYRITGLVSTGAGRGRGLGFPTANLTDIRTLIPGPGVYACQAWVGGRALVAACHIGPNPTFADSHNKVEVHVLDFAEDLYDRRIGVDFVKRIRSVRTFDSGTSLRLQVEEDLCSVRAAFAP